MVNFHVREFVKNNLPILMIIFSLIKTNYSRNNELFKNKSTLSKGNRIVKMGKLFFTNSLMPMRLFMSAVRLRCCMFVFCYSF
jgi:hypothetical protein